MQLKTPGIVLCNVKYNDKYSLVHIYTQQAGRVVYMISRPKGKGGKLSMNIFSPLNILDIEAEHLPTRDIQRIREARNLLPYQSIPSDFNKTSLLFFLSEFLSKVLKDANDCHLIYEFISESMKILEMTERSTANFHIVFMLQLIHFLGFYPNLENYAEGDYFDLLAGEFSPTTPFHRHFISRNDSQALSRLARITYTNMHHFAFNRNERKTIILHILEYYKLHVQNFADLKSLDILHELF